MAFDALEGSFFHFRNNFRASDDDTLDGSEFLNMGRIHFSYSVYLSQIVRSDLNDLTLA